MDGLKNIFCKHLGEHRSFGGQFHTSSFPALVEDLERTKVSLVHQGGKSGSQLTKGEIVQNWTIVYIIQNWMTGIIQN